MTDNDAKKLGDTPDKLALGREASSEVATRRSLEPFSSESVVATKLRQVPHSVLLAIAATEKKHKGEPGILKREFAINTAQAEIVAGEKDPLVLAVAAIVPELLDIFFEIKDGKIGLDPHAQKAVVSCLPCFQKKQ